MRLWRRPDQDQGVGIVSVRTRHHTLGAAVIEGILEAVARAERELDALVLWHEAPFALGADLKQVLEAAQAGRFDQLETMVERFQQASMRSSTPRFPWWRRSRAWPWAGAASSLCMRRIGCSRSNPTSVWWRWAGLIPGRGRMQGTGDPGASHGPAYRWR